MLREMSFSCSVKYDTEKTNGSEVEDIFLYLELQCLAHCEALGLGKAKASIREKTLNTGDGMTFHDLENNSVKMGWYNGNVLKDDNSPFISDGTILLRKEAFISEAKTRPFLKEHDYRNSDTESAQRILDEALEHTRVPLVYDHAFDGTGQVKTVCVFHLHGQPEKRMYFNAEIIRAVSRATEFDAMTAKKGKDLLAAATAKKDGYPIGLIMPLRPSEGWEDK